MGFGTCPRLSNSFRASRTPNEFAGAHAERATASQSTGLLLSPPHVLRGAPWFASSIFMREIFADLFSGRFKLLRKERTIDLCSTVLLCTSTRMCSKSPCLNRPNYDTAILKLHCEVDQPIWFAMLCRDLGAWCIPAFGRHQPAVQASAAATQLPTKGAVGGFATGIPRPP